MNTTSSVTIRPGHPADTDALVALNAEWQREQVPTLQHGFIEAALNQEAFLALIDQRQVVVAVDGSILVGYYLLNTVAPTGTHAAQRHKAEGLQRIGLLPAGPFGVGAQACLTRLYQGQGLRPRLLALLLEQLHGRYAWLFATIPHDNPRARRAHTNDGWQIVAEDVDLLYVWLPVPTAPEEIISAL
ncbi:MAG: hypothetical protein ACRYFX_30730 [Janthinobacterium lividum]